MDDEILLGFSKILTVEASLSTEDEGNFIL